MTLSQSGSSLSSVGPPTPYTVTGTASGSTATIMAKGAGTYVATFHLKLSADGTSFTGDWTDSQGSAGTATGTGGTKQTASPTPKLAQLPDPTDSKKTTGRIQSISGDNLTVVRGGKRYSASKDTMLQTGDIIETGKDTYVVAEFLIGGRVGINSDTKVAMTGERSVADVGPKTERVTIKKGSIWVKPGTTQELGGNMSGLQITSNGGTAGIRG